MWFGLSEFSEWFWDLLIDQTASQGAKSLEWLSPCHISAQGNQLAIASIPLAPAVKAENYGSLLSRTVREFEHACTHRRSVLAVFFCLLRSSNSFISAYFLRGILNPFKSNPDILACSLKRHLGVMLSLLIVISSPYSAVACDKAWDDSIERLNNLIEAYQSETHLFSNVIVQFFLPPAKIVEVEWNDRVLEYSDWSKRTWPNDPHFQRPPTRQ